MLFTYSYSYSSASTPPSKKNTNVPCFGTLSWVWGGLSEGRGVFPPGPARLLVDDGHPFFDGF